MRIVPINNDSLTSPVVKKISGMSKQFAASETPKRFQGDNRPPIAKILDSLSLSLSFCLPPSPERQIYSYSRNERIQFSARMSAQQEGNSVEIVP